MFAIELIHPRPIVGYRPVSDTHDSRRWLITNAVVMHLGSDRHSEPCTASEAGAKTNGRHRLGRCWNESTITIGPDGIPFTGLCDLA